MDLYQNLMKVKQQNFNKYIYSFTHSLPINVVFVEKLKIKNITNLLDEIALQEFKNLPPYIIECSIRKLPEIGFLLCVPFWKPSEEMTKHDYEIQNLEFKVIFDN